MGNCCDSKTKVDDHQNHAKSKGKDDAKLTKLDNGEEVDLNHYNQPDNLHKIQKIQANYKNKQKPKKD